MIRFYRCNDCYNKFSVVVAVGKVGMVRCPHCMSKNTSFTGRTRDGSFKC